MAEEAFYTAALKIAWAGAKAIFNKNFKKKKIYSIDEIKKQTQVLFIDDEAFDYLLENIRQAGWNVKQVKEIDNLDSENLKSADVIFIDYKGVGSILTPTEEGIGLLKALRHKYPLKYLIFYSGYAGFIPGHEIHDIANGWITKNADPYVYIERIEEAAKKVYNG